jgi:crossover junction endodeoxyribonuclease RuvC
LSRRIVGIDPGLTRCGIAVVDVSANRKVKFVHVDTLRSSTELDLPSRIAVLADEIERALDEYKPDLVAIERVFSQQNLRTVMGTAQISGVVMLLAKRRMIPVQMHTPTEVKAAVTGSGRAGKNQVAKMVTQILGLEEIPKPADSADALAIAITAGWRSSSIVNVDDLTPAQLAWQSAETASKKTAKR